MSDHGGQVAARLFGAACLHLAESGHDASALLADAGLPADLLDHPDRMVDDHHLQRFLDTAAAHTGDPAFGLRAGARFRTGDYGLVEALIRHTADGPDILRLVNDYLPLLGGREGARLERHDDLVVYHLTPTPEADPTPIMVDYAMASAVTLARQVLGRHDIVAWTRLRRRSSPYRAELESMLGGEVHLDADANVMAFHGAPPDQSTAVDQTVHDLLEAQAAERLYRMAEAPASTGPTVRAVLEQAEGDEFSAGSVAAALAVSERSLRRRLADEGTSFAELRDDVRRGRAEQLLVDGVTVEAIAGRLGFADGRGFQRAFKRWTGISPSAFRSGAAGR